MGIIGGFYKTLSDVRPCPTCPIFPFVGNIIHKEYGGMIVYRIPKKEICWGKVTMETIPSNITYQ